MPTWLINLMILFSTIWAIKYQTCKTSCISDNPMTLIAINWYAGVILRLCLRWIISLFKSPIFFFKLFFEKLEDYMRSRIIVHHWSFTCWRYKARRHFIHIDLFNHLHFRTCDTTSIMATSCKKSFISTFFFLTYDA